MAIRPFKCHHCGHSMRVANSTCGRCNEDKKFYQKPTFYLVPAMIILVGVPGFMSL